MRSHTVPRKLVEQFAFDDPDTRSKRLWTYEKGVPPYMSSPKSATRWDGHFADPRDAAKEEQLEKRLNHEIEEPVNEFLEQIRYRAFVLSEDHKRKLTRYITVLFNRSRARLGATQHLLDKMLESMEALLSNDDQLQAIADKVTVDLLTAGVRLERNATKEEIPGVLRRTIEQHKADDQLRHNYAETIERMLSFEDLNLLNGNWDVLRTEADDPFAIGDAPVVTWERTNRNTLVFGQGTARPNVEVFLPVAPTACLYLLPATERTRVVMRPQTVEINMAEASFATRHCFTNINSAKVDQLLQAQFSRTRLGVNAFTLNHRDFSNTMFEILMNQRAVPS